MAALEQLESTATLTEKAHQRIKLYILSEDLPRGERLTEEFFARKLGISKSPVREAMNSLQREGLLRIEPRKGAFIPTFSAREIDDLYVVREILETSATSLAVVTPRLIADLRRSVQRTERSLLQDDKAAHIAEDIAFHARIVRAAGNKELSRLHANIQDKLWLCRCQTFQLTSPSTPEAHCEITEALANRDVPAAVQATQRHIRFVSRTLQAAQALQEAAKGKRERRDRTAQPAAPKSTSAVCSA